jgi:hypothetical protein
MVFERSSRNSSPISSGRRCFHLRSSSAIRSRSLRVHVRRRSGFGASAILLRTALVMPTGLFQTDAQPSVACVCPADIPQQAQVWSGDLERRGTQLRFRLRRQRVRSNGEAALSGVGRKAQPLIRSSCLRRGVDRRGLKVEPVSLRMGDPAGEFVGFNHDDVRCSLCRVFQTEPDPQPSARKV